MDDSPGVKEIVVIASRWPQQTLEQVQGEGEDMVAPGRDQEQIKILLDTFARLDAVTTEVPGLAFARHPVNMGF